MSFRRIAIVMAGVAIFAAAGLLSALNPAEARVIRPERLAGFNSECTEYSWRGSNSVGSDTAVLTTFVLAGTTETGDWKFTEHDRLGEWTRTASKQEWCYNPPNGVSAQVRVEMESSVTWVGVTSGKASYDIGHGTTPVTDGDEVAPGADLSIGVGATYHHGISEIVTVADGECLGLLFKLPVAGGTFRNYRTSVHIRELGCDLDGGW
jgi:hypothetical protein